jgi:PAS domain S-box-containing protein
MEAHRVSEGDSPGVGPGSLALRLPPDPSSVGRAREQVRALLSDASRDDLTETATLLVSEVVTNALLHAGTPIDVTARLTSEGLRVEVGDGSAHFPVRRHYAATAGTGRGMMLLEQLVDEWGVSRHGSGKKVWFRVSQGDLPEDDHPGTVGAAEAGSPRTAPDSVGVTLLNVPLLLHAAWREHAAALLREYLLASIDIADADEAIRIHADATDAMAVLEESIPQAQVTIEPDRVMDQATGANVTADRVEVEVPAGSVEHFRTLQEAIDAALAMAGAGLFLTPPTQPEVQGFRRWVCREVERQSHGDAPAGWSIDEAPGPLPDVTPLRWDVSVVTDADHAVLAADDANRILAASRPALDLLGYAEAGDLVGRRIVAIIPERYRQAHIAGFTMYFLTERQPLVGSKVVVPALRGDGTEVMVQMLLMTRATEAGREVFLAELEPVGSA